MWRVGHIECVALPQCVALMIECFVFGLDCVCTILFVCGLCFEIRFWCLAISFSVFFRVFIVFVMGVECGGF